MYVIGHANQSNKELYIICFDIVTSSNYVFFEKVRHFAPSFWKYLTTLSNLTWRMWSVFQKKNTCLSDALRSFWRATPATTIEVARCVIPIVIKHDNAWEKAIRTFYFSLVANPPQKRNRWRSQYTNVCCKTKNTFFEIETEWHDQMRSSDLFKWDTGVQQCEVPKPIPCCALWTFKVQFCTRHKWKTHCLFIGETDGGCDPCFKSTSVYAMHYAAFVDNSQKKSTI